MLCRSAHFMRGREDRCSSWRHSTRFRRLRKTIN